MNYKFLPFSSDNTWSNDGYQEINQADSQSYQSKGCENRGIKVPYQAVKRTNTCTVITTGIGRFQKVPTQSVKKNKIL